MYFVNSLRLTGYLFIGGIIGIVGFPAWTNIAQAALPLDARARILAGLEPRAEEKNLPEVQAIINSPAWQQAARTNSLSSRLKVEGHLFTRSGEAQMRQFFTNALGRAGSETQNLLYLFAGPDVTYANLLFPNLKRTVLVALQPPAAPLDPENLVRTGVLGARMGAIGNAFRSLISASYFITRQMDQELTEFGTSTMVLVGLAAQNFRITGYNEVSLAESGELLEDRRGAIPGFRVRYQKPNREEGEVFYFKFDLSTTQQRQYGPNVASHPGILRFLDAMNFETAYFKAATYINHNPEFDTINRYVASKVRHIVQSDDGLPVKFILGESPNWDVRLYGFFASTIFGEGLVQTNLRSLYGEQICTSPSRQAWLQTYAPGCSGGPSRLTFRSVVWGGTIPFAYSYSAKAGQLQRGNLQVYSRSH